jgi:hypothetical protein
MKWRTARFAAKSDSDPSSMGELEVDDRLRSKLRRCVRREERRLQFAEMRPER